MPTKQWVAGFAAVLLLGNAQAQETATSTEKVENKTAVTPVENNKLNGVSVPLNIKTLAEIQRLQDEQAMREQMAIAMKAGGSITGNVTTPAPAAKPAASAKVASPVAVKPKPKAEPRISPNTLLGVYGTSGAMTAEIQTAGRDVRTLREGEQLGKFNVRRISNNGVELVANNGSTQHVSVGTQVRF